MHGSETRPAVDQMKNEGIAFLYRGMLPPLLQKTMSLSLMFGIYDQALQLLYERDFNPYIAKAMAGVIAGCFECGLMPFERLQIILVNPEYHTKFKNTLAAALFIYKVHGIREFYRGLTPCIIKTCPSNSFFFIMKDEAKMRLPAGETRIRQGFQNFLVGASIGAFSSTLFYPITVIRINFQSHMGGPFRNIISGFFAIMEKRQNSLMKLYKGALLNISRSFISWGVVNTSYEFFRWILY